MSRLLLVMLMFQLFGGLFHVKLPKIEILDGPGMVYVDSEHRTDYANQLPFTDEDRYMWAIAFLGRGEAGEHNGQYYIDRYFSSLSEEARSAIRHFDFGGDEWYLIVPRYWEYNEITRLDDAGNEMAEHSERVQNGEPFIIRCNPQVGSSNIKISLSIYGGYTLSPRIDPETGRLAADENVLDITEYDRVDTE